MNAIDTSAVIHVKLSQLVDAPENVRKTNINAGHDTLKASILARGVLQNLIAYEVEGNKYAVTAGGRRRRALLALAKEKKIGKSFEVPVLVRPREEAVALSLAENADRENMHPADELMAFASLIADGDDIEDVAAKYAVTPGVVRQRLKLAALSPVIIKALREDTLTLGQAMGFTVTDDHKRQEKVFAEITNRLETINRSQIVNIIADGKIETTDGLFIYAAQEYSAAGGTVTADLFADLFDNDPESYADDGDLLRKLAAEKLEKLAEVERKKGWKWVKVDTELAYAPGGFQRAKKETRAPTEDEKAAFEAVRERVLYFENIEAERDRTEDEEQQYKQFLTMHDEMEEKFAFYSPEVMALSGGWMIVNAEGEAIFLHAYVKPEDRKAYLAYLEKGREPEPGDDEQEGGEDGDEAASGADEAPAGPHLSDTLLTTLHAERTEAMNKSLSQDPSRAVRVLAFHLAASVFCFDYQRHRVLNISGAHISGDANAAMAAWKQKLPSNPKELFDRLMDADATSQDEIMALLAVLTAAQVDATYQRAQPQAGRAAKPGLFAEKLATHMRLDMSQFWTPTADSYFRHVPKGQILDAVREAKGEDEAKRLAVLKKAALVAEAEQVMAGTGWLPHPLRTRA